MAASSASAEEAIKILSDAITVERDGTVHVVETIGVRAEGINIRRGIFRDIGTTFEDAEGKVHKVGFKLIGLTRDGQPEAYHTERHSDYIRIYAGQEDIFLEPGDYTYVLTYETDRQVRWFDGKPELFWNVTGNDWMFPIDKAAATLTLPDKRPPVRWEAYTGRIGERGKDFRGGIVDNALSVMTTRRLEPGEGFTIVAEIPADAVDAPSASDSFLYLLRDYIEWVIGAIGLIVVFAYYLWAWNSVGRDPKGGTIIPLFHPPPGVSPPLATYIDNWGFGGSPWKAFTASALSLAVRGLLVFDQEGKDLVFERTATPLGAGDSLSAGEQTVLDWVEKEGGRAEINKKNGKAVQAISTKFQSSVRKEAGARYFKRNLVHFAIGVLLSVLTVGAIVVFGELAEEELGLLIGMIFVGTFLSFFIVPVIASIFDRKSRSSLIVSLIVLVVVVGVVLYFAAQFAKSTFGDLGSLGTALFAAFGSHAFPFAVVLVLPILNGIFYYLLRAPTPEGRPVMDQLEGFRMYMDTAESGRLNIENAPEITSERFEALLPFAVALGVERPWANAFQSALARAYPNDPDPMSHYHARWRRGGSWSGTNFGSSIASAVSSATSAMSSSIPRSSSSSSGFSGGSGGGGGGRGGGGW